MKEFLRKLAPFFIFVLIILTISMVAVMINNIVFINPIMKKQITTTVRIGEGVAKVLKRHNGEIYLLNEDVNRLEQGMIYIGKMEDMDNVAFQALAMMIEVKDARIQLLEKDVVRLKGDIEKLKQRHLELLRATAILQKKHWKEIP